MAVAEEQRPIRLVVRDAELRRSRLTVFFRLLLAIPHLVWVTLWGIAAFVVAFVLWLGILVNGRAPGGLHDFVTGYLRYTTHLSGYLFLAANRYPGFRGAPGYAIDLEVDGPVRQSRWSAFFRLLLALPALLLAGALGGGFATGSSGSGSWSAGVGNEDTLLFALSWNGGAAAVAAFLAWFAILARGRVPQGLRDLVAFALSYGAQAGGYLLLLTQRYPTSDPALAEPYSELPEHPVRIVVEDDLGRPRITVFFRLFLALPHIVWLGVWSIGVFFAAVAAWLVALVSGRVPDPLRRFLTAYVRYGTHVYSYLYLVGRRFPGFTGRAGSYGIDLEVDPAGRQSRWKTLFRLVLAIPALILSAALGGVAAVVAFLGWWFALARARMPEGLRNLGAACLRYSAQASAYILLCTDRYPYAAPVLRDRSAEEPWPAQPAPVGDAF